MSFLKTHTPLLKKLPYSWHCSRAPGTEGTYQPWQLAAPVKALLQLPMEGREEAFVDAKAKCEK